MQRSDFNFDLPEALIAQYPIKERSASRLLHLQRHSERVQHHCFKQLPDFLNAGDLLVLNDTKVIPARLYGRKQTGGKAEILVESVLDETSVLAHIRVSKALKPGAVIQLTQGIQLKVVARKGECWLCHFEGGLPVSEILIEIGHLPLPPYIKRPADAQDWQRYQTVYAQKQGAIAAPTAGLHFDESLLKDLQAKDIRFAYITLHIGAGTFQPLRSEDLSQHKMHREYMEIDQSTCDMIKGTQARGGRIIAVGTTVVRCLETAMQAGDLKPFSGDTDIFIYPGSQFKIVEGLITNFHLPGSTLLMLVSAFAGYDNTMSAYQSAVAHQYRFYSYGDAMLIL
ncbi:MAG: tRNA preQ1(34) S-adenosylmethionine ribosyltransferase-isomerase QueA [Gammaproteobacteria bacterium]